MAGQYYICPVCRRSYTEIGKENKKKIIRFCPECGREMKTVQFNLLKRM